MKKYIKKLAKGGLFITIGGQDIDYPFREIWWGDDPLAMLLQDGMDVVDILIGFSAIVAVVMIVVSGYQLITAAGDPEKIESGQKTLTAAIIGLIIVLLVGLIIKFVLEQMKYI